MSHPSSTASAAPGAADITVESSLTIALARDLGEFDLPTRLRNWAERAGIKTLGGLAAHSPGSLLEQRNLGRKSVAEARAFIEDATGLRWEELASKLAATSLALEPVSSGLRRHSWDALRTSLAPEHRLLLLDNMPLPVRVRNFAVKAELRTLGELAEVSHGQLVEAPNLGRTSIAELPNTICDYLDALAGSASFVAEGLLECFKRMVEPLEIMLRIIATRRSGLGGAPMTLQELGDVFGITRERIRQLEQKSCEQLARHPWSMEARRRIESVLQNGAVPFDVLAQDPWWSAACAQPAVVAFILEHVLEIAVHVVELDESLWLSRHQEDVMAKAFSELIAEARTAAFPASLDTFTAMAEQRAAPFGPRVAAAFLEELKGRMQLEEEEGRSRVLAFGDTRAARLLAILRAAPEPMHVDELSHQLGVRFGSLPDEVLHFRRGYLGLRQHFPDFERWRALLAPVTVRLIQELGPERQWYCGELLDELREQFDIPDWLTVFGLASLLKGETALRYLGRQRVVLADHQDNDRRIYVHEALVQLLLDAGEPMTKAALIEKLDQKLGISQYGTVVFMRPQFVRLDDELIGLLARDVPGGTSAIIAAGDLLESVLERHGRGLSEFHAHEHIAALSADHSTWSVPLAVSVLRSDGRFRLSQNGAVGLAAWESTRVPTRLELVRSAVEEAGGRVAVATIMALVLRTYGQHLARSTLISLAMNVGAGVDGEWVTKKDLIPEDAVVDR